VQAHAAQGLAGLLQTCPATVAALQGVLPFIRPPHQLITQQPSLQEAPQQQQQQQSNLFNSSNSSSSCTTSGTPNSAVRPAPVLQAPPGSSSSSASIGQRLDGMITAGHTSTKLPSLLELLPPAQQAWLVGDVVAGLLLHQHADDASSSSSRDRHNNSRYSCSCTCAPAISFCVWLPALCSCVLLSYSKAGQTATVYLHLLLADLLSWVFLQPHVPTQFAEHLVVPATYGCPSSKR
jgi:hypothetical protein